MSKKVKQEVTKVVSLGKITENPLSVSSHLMLTAGSLRGNDIFSREITLSKLLLLLSEKGSTLKEKKMP